MQTLINLNQKYHSFFVPNSSGTLTIVQNKRAILGNLFSLASFFWILPEKNLWVQTQKFFEKQVKQPLICCQSAEQAKNLIKNYETSVIIFQSSTFKNNISIFQQEMRSKKITHIICIGPASPYESKCITFVDNKQKVLDEISENKYSYNKANDFINFIFVSQEIQDSSTLVKTMFGMLNQETDRAQMIKYMGEVAKVACPPYRIKEVEQFVKKNIEKQKKFSNTIKWYTKESFLYGFVNSILRLCKDPTAIYVLQPYFKDLFQSISKLYLEQQKKKSDETQNYRSFYCYRGAAISEREVQQFKSNINSVVENLGFLSTSTQMEVANGFVINVLYQIEVHDDVRHSQLDFGFAFVDRYSSKSGEQEVIFNPLNTFKVLEVSQISSDKPIYIIRLKYGELARITSCNKTQLNKQQIKYKILGEYRISERGNFKLIGDVLVQNDYNLQGSKEYCEKYLQIALESKNEINIYNAYSRQAKYYENNKEYEKMLQNFSKMLSLQKTATESDPTYYNCLSKLGTGFIEARKYEKAIQYLQKCVRLSKRIFGSFSSQHIIVLNNLSVAYLNSGKYERALSLLNQTKKIQKETFGENNQLFLSILKNLGAVYYRMGAYPKAIESLERALHMDQISLGEDHPRCIKTYLNLALVYLMSNEFSKALPLFLKTESIQKQCFGTNTLSYVSNLQYIGVVYSKLNQFETSLQYFNKCKTFYEKNTLYEKDLSEVLESLGEVYNQLEKYQQSLEHFQESLKLTRKIMGVSSSKYINTLMFIGNVYIRLGLLENAMQTLMEAELLQVTHFGSENFQYSLILMSLGVLYEKLGDLSTGLIYLKRSQKIQKNTVDLNTNRIYPKVLGQIGEFYMKSKQFQSAIPYFEESLRIKRKIWGKNHHQYASTLGKLGEVHRLLGQYQDALNKFKQLKNIMKVLFGQRHQKYIETLNIIANVYEKLGEFSLPTSDYKKCFQSKMSLRIANELSQSLTVCKFSLAIFELGCSKSPIRPCSNDEDALETDTQSQKFQYSCYLDFQF